MAINIPKDQVLELQCELIFRNTLLLFVRLWFSTEENLSIFSSTYKMDLAGVGDSMLYSKFLERIRHLPRSSRLVAHMAVGWTRSKFSNFSG